MSGRKRTNGRTRASDPWEPLFIQSLEDPAEAQAYLDAAMRDGEVRYILTALQDITKAQGGYTKLARKTGLSRENLYTALSEDGNPRLESITKILNSLGLRMSVERLPEQKRRFVRAKPVARAKAKTSK